MKVKEPQLVTVLLVIIFNFFYFQATFANIVVVGAGYVGLVTAAGLAACNNSVVCLDVDRVKIDNLCKGVMPFFEPGLQELVKNGVEKKFLRFSTDVSAEIETADIVFIAVGTPATSGGHADLSALHMVFDVIAETMNHYKMNSYKLIVIKSTVPLNTNGRFIQWMIEKGVKKEYFDIVNCPEFLREGSAVYDFFNPDRMVVGASSNESAFKVVRLFPFIEAKQIPLIITDPTSAEMIKYASNAFLAVKVSFINEIANICDHMGADVAVVSRGLGLDHRISPYFLSPGPGFGGSCFPKDSLEIVSTARDCGIDVPTISGSLLTNQLQKQVAFQKLTALCGSDLRDKKIAILGLAFKANTDDIRYSPSIDSIMQLQAAGAKVVAYDPYAMENMQKLFPDLIYAHTSMDALVDANACVIMTDWAEFKTLDFERMASVMANPVVIDMRNVCDIALCKAYGIICDIVGRSTLLNQGM